MDIKNHLPQVLASLLSDDVFEKALEIRLRVGYKARIRYPDRSEEVDITVTPQLLSDTLQLICEYSLYAYAGDIARGFVTIGGWRVGIAGSVIFSNGESRGIKTVSGLNIRVARQVKGCAKTVMPYILKDGKIFNTLIISPPLCGKTTLLRDIVLSLGNMEKNTVVIDERCEIASVDINGVPQHDIGKCTDVLSGCTKAVGIMMALRSLAPEVIALDEIGEKGDIEAINRALTAGAAVICTVHSDDIVSLKNKKYIAPLIKDKLFERFIVLKDRKVSGVFDAKGVSLCSEQQVP